MPDSAPLRETVATRMKEAMKGGDKIRGGALRPIMAALNEREIEARGAGKIDSRLRLRLRAKPRCWQEGESRVSRCETRRFAQGP